MTTALTRASEHAIAIGEQYGFDRGKVELIKEIVAKGTSDDELALFLYTAQRTGLDPLARQIYCIMRKDRGVAKMTIQTGIDGYRLIADRTGNYAPGRATTYEYTEDNKVYSATAYVMKFAKNTWHEVSATAFWDEYVATTFEGKVQGLWNSKPRVMLGKCAEALALRRAFPAELSGLYTDSEMDQAGPMDVTPPPLSQPVIIEPDSEVDLAVAERAFWEQFSGVLGSTDWAAAQSVLNTKRQKPDRVEGWERAEQAMHKALAAELERAA